MIILHSLQLEHPTWTLQERALSWKSPACSFDHLPHDARQIGNVKWFLLFTMFTTSRQLPAYNVKPTASSLQRWSLQLRIYNVEPTALSLQCWANFRAQFDPNLEEPLFRFSHHFQIGTSESPWNDQRMFRNFRHVCWQAPCYSRLPLLMLCGTLCELVWYFQIFPIFAK